MDPLEITDKLPKSPRLVGYPQKMYIPDIKWLTMYDTAGPKMYAIPNKGQSNHIKTAIINYFKPHRADSYNTTCPSRSALFSVRNN